jgi:hypothetical protein
MILRHPLAFSVFSSQLVFAHDLQVRIWLQQSGCEWEGAERTQAAVFAGFGGKSRSVPSLSHPFFVKQNALTEA